MHELSVALDVCRIAEEQVGAGTLARVTEVGLDVGENAGIEVENLRFCLEVLLSHPPFGSAVPRIRRVEGEELRVSYLEVDDDDGP